MRDAESPTYRGICGLAEAQSGFVKRVQLMGASVSAKTIESWLEGGRLIRAYQGVYAVGHMPSDPKARAYGAMLAAGDQAALSGWSAGAYYGAIRTWREPFELISPRRSRVSGVVVHTSRMLLLRDVFRYPGGLRVTSPARTALDLAPRVLAGRLHALVDHLRLRHSLNLSHLTDVLARNPRHPGAQPLLRLVGEAPGRAGRSDLERRRWPQFAREHHIGPYETNVRVAGYEVDVLVDGLVIVELDTFGTHLLNFESDRLRDAEILARTGIPTIRITDGQLSEDGARAAAQILAAVARRRTERPAPSDPHHVSRTA